MLTLLLCMLAGTPAPAAPFGPDHGPGHAFNPERIAGMIRAGQAEAAYQHALEHRAQLGGQTLFDFWYGVAALDSGHISEGIFALERVHLQHPSNDRVRLELARGYFLAGEDRRAKRHFEAVLADDPPAPVAATNERYLLAIERRADRYTTVVTGYAEAGGGYDSNVNSATAAATFDLFGILPVRLSDESREQGDDFERAAAGAELRHPLTPDTTFFLAGDLERVANDDYDQFDITLAEIRTGTVFYHREDLQTRLRLRLQRFEVGGEPYRDLAGIDLNIHRRASARTAIAAGFLVAQQTYEDQEIRDAMLGIISASVTHIWDMPMRPMTSFGVFVGHEEPDEDSDNANAVAERKLGGVSGALYLNLAPAWTMQAGLQYRRSEYGAEQLLLGTTRKENYYQADLALNWQPTTHWRIGPRLRYTVNDANSELFEYDRTEVELRARYEFH